MESVIIRVVRELENIEGLDNIHVLDEKQKERIEFLEEKNNIGVFECLKRQVTLVVTHDSSFREPIKSIVIKGLNKIIFPPVEFPEVNRYDVVSSSPCKIVHEYLIKQFNLDLTAEDATLLIGFNIE